MAIEAESVAALDRLVSNLRAKGVRSFEGNLTVSNDVVWTVKLEFERVEREAKRSRHEDE